MIRYHVVKRSAETHFLWTFHFTVEFFFFIKSTGVMNYYSANMSLFYFLFFYFSLSYTLSCLLGMLLTALVLFPMILGPNLNKDMLTWERSCKMNFSCNFWSGRVYGIVSSSSRSLLHLHQRLSAKRIPCHDQWLRLSLSHGIYEFLERIILRNEKETLVRVRWAQEAV